MKFTEITRESDDRILCYRPLRDGAEFAICFARADGEFQRWPQQDTVTIPRTTRRWIGHTLYTLQWKKDDFQLVTAALRDPRLEMYWTHPARSRVLKLPDFVLPQDGFRQVASVWCLDSQHFAACISEDANRPAWWGEQIAALMNKIVMKNMQGEADRNAGLSAVLTGYYDALPRPDNDAKYFGSRYDWFKAESSVEAIAIWYNPDIDTLTLWHNDLIAEPYWWGVACAALTHEVVETLYVEREEQRQVIIETMTPPFSARLTEARAAFERETATVQ